ncbi:peptidoglycan-binding domain-containing protein [Pseudactinotalea terrae]|uniref:peptidoglycan-binding domain-containing protein n=1 Tax=Pseudactinotalea terrae TaxID=1743262 RepID=UPI0012E19CC3|nr:peptidoglycan-binding domain-containing protein [Pseudactinotalea terrae]
MSAQAVSELPRRAMGVPSAAERVERASAAIGRGASYSGMCEKFVRTCFGFSARYPSARQAWEATERRRSGTPPAGVPVFWDITSGKNNDFDHVAISVGGGVCISTSAGPGRTVARVGIEDLTRRWGMLYRGWAEDYHGVLVHEPEVVDLQTTPQGWPEQDLPVKSAHTADSLRAWRLLMASIGLTDALLELAMQRWLRRRGYYASQFALDGDFGPRSITALQRFLQAKGLYPHDTDGWRGPLTIGAEIRYLNVQRRYL